MDSPELSGPPSLVHRLAQAGRFLSALALLALLVLIVVEIVARSIFHTSTFITEEISAYLLIGILFLGVSDAYVSDSLLRVDLSDAFIGRTARRLLRIVFDVISLGFVLMLDWAVFSLMWRNFSRNVHAPTLLETPIWIPQALMPLGATLLAVVILGTIVRNLFGAEQAEG